MAHLIGIQTVTIISRFMRADGSGKHPGVSRTCPGDSTLQCDT